MCFSCILAGECEEGFEYHMHAHWLARLVLSSMGAQLRRWVEMGGEKSGLTVRVHFAETFCNDSFIILGALLDMTQEVLFLYSRARMFICTTFPLS